jgi:hypothetical protein
MEPNGRSGKIQTARLGARACSRPLGDSDNCVESVTPMKRVYLWFISGLAAGLLCGTLAHCPAAGFEAGGWCGIMGLPGFMALALLDPILGPNVSPYVDDLIFFFSDWVFFCLVFSLLLFGIGRVRKRRPSRS